VLVAGMTFPLDARAAGSVPPTYPG
jgi:hypothetical protein